MVVEFVGDGVCVCAVLLRRLYAERELEKEVWL